MDAIQEIDKLIRELWIFPITKLRFDRMKSKGEIIIRNVFGENSDYLQDIDNIVWDDNVDWGSEEYNTLKAFAIAKQFRELFEKMQDEIKSFHTSTEESQTHWTKNEPSDQFIEERFAEIEPSDQFIEERFAEIDEHYRFEDMRPASESDMIQEEQSNQIFIVHGHDEAMKHSVARALERLGLEPVILHEKPNIGRTIIEKFTDYSSVGFAVVLLSPDDKGYPKNEDPDNFKFRARQNVILELGYFLGKLGRSRVVSLYKKDEKFEMPSDFTGVIFVRYDDTDRWKFDLVKELIANGYEVNANKLLE